MNTGEIIKMLRTSRGLTQEELGNVIGVQKSAIAKYEKGRVENLKRASIEKLATFFGVSPSYILGINDGDQNEENMYKQSGIDFFRIPLYSPICCGDGGFNEDNILEYVPVPSKGLSNPDNYFCQIADGNSMIDAGIDNGDLLVFEKVNRIDTGCIGCFCVDENTAMCKKYTVVNNIVMLMPMNSDYEPVIVDPLDSCFRCIGRLRKVIKDF